MIVSENVYQVNDNAILFFNDDLLAERINIRKCFHTPEKCDENPILIPDRPWEGGRIQPWGSVYEWEGKWRCLYNGYAKTSTPGIGVLETEDGKHWYRPDLHLHEVEGSTANNLLIPSHSETFGNYPLLPSLIKHPSPPDESFTWLLYLWSHREATKNKPRFNGMHVYKSADGLNFTQASREPVVKYHNMGYGGNLANDVVSVYYDSQAGCFTLYAAVMLPTAPEGITPWDNAAGYSRYLACWQSENGIEWSEPRLMLTPDRHEAAWQQYYGVSVASYEGLWLGLPLYYYALEQYMEPHLILSYDRRTWQRPSRQAFIPSGDSPSRWDYGGVWPAWDFLEIGDELIFPYGGLRHREHTRRAEMAFGTATLRKDGFVSLVPAGDDAGSATIQTIPLCGVGAKGLCLNTEPDWHEGEDRWLSVAVEDIEGNVIPGYSMEDCGQIDTPNSTTLMVRWKEKELLPDTSALRLRITISKQRLYAIRFITANDFN